MVLKERLEEIWDDFKYAFIEKFTLFMSIGFLIFNLLLFALFMRESWKVSLILAAVFLIYVPIGYYDKQEEIWIICSRVLEVIMSLALTLAYILLFRKFWLLFLPVLEGAGMVLFYVFVYRPCFPKAPERYRRSMR